MPDAESKAPTVQVCEVSISWGEYEAGLRRRGDLTIWLSDEALDDFNRRLVKWARRTYRLSSARARGWLARLAGRQRDLFVHWSLLLPTTG